MKQVIIFPTGTLDKKDKERLSKEGYVAIEAPDPSAVVTLLPGAQVLTGDDLLMSAMAGLSGGWESHKAAMVTEMHRRLKLREAEKLARQPRQTKAA